MADQKISQLTAATTPLAGTEVLPIVQSGSTVKVSVANLTAGRTVNAAEVVVTSSTDAYPLLINVTAGSTAGVEFQDPTTTTKPVIGSRGNNLAVEAGGNEVIRFGSNNNITVNTGNLVIGTSGKGIDFSATPGTGTSELLSDYEEGDWTPVVAATSGIIISYTASGTYTKVGRLVTATFTYNITSVGTGTGAITVTAPFTAGSGANYPTGSSREVAVAGWGGYTGMDPSGTTITVQKYDGGFAGATGVVVRGTISYQV